MKRRRKSSITSIRGAEIPSFLGIPVGRRTILFGALGLVGAAGVGVLATMRKAVTTTDKPELVVYRDPGCGCCKKWVAHVEEHFSVKDVPSQRLDEVRQKLGVPNDLIGCHTATVAGLTIEGHVPLADIQRLLRERPVGIAGLAVTGMPNGSPGMETEDGTVDPYEVIAFGAGGQRLVFARYGGTIPNTRR